MERLTLKIFIVIIFICIALLFAGCNRQVIDVTYRFDSAIISLPNGDIIEGKVQSWRDFEDGDQIQVEIDNVIYLTHAGNVVLISE